MDWKSVKFDWNRARAFLVTAEEGSLSAAAKALGMAQPTLGRQVDALEEELGVILFERLGRGLSLTPSGHELLSHVRSMGEAASQMSLAATGRSEALEGSICITATEVTAIYDLAPIIAKLRKIHPGVEVEVAASDDSKDLRRREADIAMRNYRPKENDLVARKIGEEVAMLYASADYIEKYGVPNKLRDLRNHKFVGFDGSDEMVKQLSSIGLEISDDNITVRAGNHMVHWELTKAGVGIGIMPERVGDLEPKVRSIMPSFRKMVYPVWLVAHRELHTSRRIRTVFDFIASEYSAKRRAG
ncbi:MAG: LysR family transcriptional regulator [Rhizobiaceae bacterium]|nr:LysR family transcriptional regulator [Rhizobiaceae bacterium]